MSLCRLFIFVCLFNLLCYGAGHYWRQCYDRHIVETGYEGDIFRPLLHHADKLPVYGITQSAASVQAQTSNIAVGIIALLLLGAQYVGLWRYKQRARIFLLGSATALLLAFGYSDGSRRLVGDTVGHIDEYRAALPHFSGTGDLLHRYVAEMPQMEGRNRHYPPGNVVYLQVCQQFGWLEYAKLGLVFIAACCLLPLLGICRLLQLSASTAWIAALCTMTNTAFLVFPTLDFVPIALFFALSTLYFWLKALEQGTYRFAFAVGLLLAAHAFFTFTAIVMIWLLFILLTVGLYSKIYTWRNTWRSVCIALVTFLGIYVCLYIATGYDIWHCFWQSVRNNRLQMASGFDDPQRYLLRSTGNLLAYCSSIGMLYLPLAAVGLFQSIKKSFLQATILSCLAFSWVITLLISAFCGLFFLETERIWLFFTPLPLIFVATTLENSLQSYTHKKLITWLLIVVSLYLSLHEELSFHYFMHPL